MLCEIPLIHLAVCEYLEWKTKPARRLAWMAFRVKSNLKYIFISLPEKDSQEISKVYSNTHWCYKYFFSRKKMLSTLFLTIYMGRGFYFKTRQTSLSDWLSLSYPQVLHKHNGEFPIMTKIHNPVQNVSYCKSVQNVLYLSRNSRAISLSTLMAVIVNKETTHNV